MLAACGDDGSASAPADFAPAGTPLYLEASRADEGQVAAAEALIAELGELPLLGSTLDPEELAASALEESAAESGADFSYARDIEPWLGDRLALAFLSFEGFEGEADPTDFVFVLETTDEEVARESVERILEGDPETEFEETEIAGEPSFRDTAEGGAIAFADGFLLLAESEGALERALEAPGGDSLPESDLYVEASAGLPEERLAFGFVDLAAAIDYAAATGGATAEEVEMAEAFYGDALEAPVSFALSAGERALALDLASGVGQLGLAALGDSELIAQAPGDAIAILSLGDVGAQARSLLDRLGELPAAGGDPAFDATVIAERFEAEVGVALDDMLAAIGETSAWVRGAPPESYAVGIEALTRDDRAPAALLDALERELRAEGFRTAPAGDGGFTAEAGGPLGTGGIGFLRAQSGAGRLRVVLGTDRAQVERPGAGAVGGTPGFAAAETALGADRALTAYADLGPILDRVVDGGSALDVITGTSSPEQLVLGYLAGKLGYAAIGAREEADRLIQRLVIGLE